jgi:hypothetical protein
MISQITAAITQSHRSIQQLNAMSLKLNELADGLITPEKVRKRQSLRRLPIAVFQIFHGFPGKSLRITCDNIERQVHSAKSPPKS